MSKDVADLKEQLAAQKARIKLKEKQIRQREAAQRMRAATAIGRLACKAGIDQIPSELLFGAFLEIASTAKDTSAQERWTKFANGHQEMQEQESQTPLSVSFSEPPPKEIRTKLRELKFRWNAFRQEYYGYGCKAVIEQLLHGLPYKLDIIS